MALHLPTLVEVEAALSKVTAAIPALEALDVVVPEPEHTAVAVALKVALEVLTALNDALHEIP